jgi:hypothetical protein
MGSVHVALDRLTGQTVALKRVLIPTENLQFNSKGSSDLYVALAQEFRIMASLRHPNVNSVLDYGFDWDNKRQPFFTMDLLKNPISVFRAGWKSDQEKVNMLVQTLQALAYLHRRGIIHRDLKPANILVVSQQVKVLDFGLSVTRDQAEEKVIAGTLGYIAPETLLGDAPSEASDLYAVGVIGFELFTGRPFIESDDTQVLIDQTIRMMPDLRMIGNVPVAAVLGRLVSKNPEDRYNGNANLAIAALCEAVGQSIPRESTAIRESYLQTAQFVGRESEMWQLSDGLDAALNGKGGIWLIGGESGSGKTRLLDELRIQALVKGAMVLRGQNIAQGASPYQMWRAPMRALSLTTQFVDMQASVLKAIVPDIAEILGVDVPDAPDVSPVFAQERLWATIEAVFQMQTRPLLLILEDLHWAGRESIDLFARLVKYVSNLPLMIIGSYRNDESPDLDKSTPGAKLITLNRLDDAQIEEMSAAMLGESGHQPELVELLRRETEGNPFFLVEIMRSLAEQAGRLDQISAMTLPEEVSSKGINQIIRRRLDRVPAEARELLRIAALCGRRVDQNVLAAFAGSTEVVDKWLLTCEEVSVLEVQDNTWQFSHDKLREGVVEEVPDFERPIMHRKIAETMEKTGTGDYAMLAYQWGMAGEFDKEKEYRVLCGKFALGSGAYDTAVFHLERALELEVPTPESYKQWANLKRMAADAYLGLGNRDSAQRLYDEALAAYQKANYKWGVGAAMNDLGFLAFEAQDFALAEENFHRSLQITVSVRAWTITLNSIIGIASLHVERHDLNRAAELCTMALNHMSIDQQTADRAARLMTRIKAGLWPAALAEAEARGKESRLSEVAQAILKG